METMRGSFWHRLAEAERAALVRAAQHKRYDRGTTLIRGADRGRWAAILHSGQVRVVSVDGTRTISTRSAGDIVGEQALIDQGTRSATVVANTVVQALVLGSEEFERVLHRYPRVLRVLCAVVSDRLREADGVLSGQADDASTKVVLHLLRHAGAAGGPRIPVPITSQAALGELLGVSRESVVRALRKLRAESVVTTQHGVVTIRDLDALRSWTSR